MASKPIDFHTLKETKCPSTAASYQEWVAKFQSYALSKGRPDAVIQTAFAGVKENPEISDRASKQPEFVTPVWSLSRPRRLGRPGGARAGEVSGEQGAAGGHRT